MLLQRSFQCLTVAGLLAATATTVSADAHKWEISEVFSNADGTIQYIEWFTGDDDEQFLTLESLSTGSGNSFNFPNNLPSSFTGGRRFLMATPGFAAISGMPTPDYIMPAGFINPAGDTLNYTGGDVVSFGALPTDGTSAVSRTGTPMASSPQNFTGDTASVLLAISTVRNGSGLNALCFSADPPRLGQPWSATVTTSGHPGATAGYMYARTRAASGPTIGVGELLVDLTSQFLFEMTAVPAGGQANFAGVIPSDMALLGASLSSQGVIFGGGVELCNAVDMTVGQ